MGKCKFSKGDYVRIRPWEEMTKLYGEKDGVIEVMPVFTNTMRCYCGEVRQIDTADELDGSYMLEGVDTYWFAENALEAAKEPRELKEGDRVLVRSWESMAMDFGLDEDGDIKSDVCFSKAMKEFCGTVHTIKKATGINRFNLDETGDYIFTSDHLTLVGSEIKEGDTVRIKAWDELEREYGLDDSGNIDTPDFPFYDCHKHLCGATLVVDRVDDSDNTFMDADGDWYPLCCVTKVDDEVTTGLADKQEHYKNAAMQPLEVMQTLFTAEQFKGFLLGNFVKYSMRANFKGQADSDRDKARQYAYWYSLVKNDESYRISPAEDVPADDWDGEGVFAC